MASVLVDSKVILDIMTLDPMWSAWSEAAVHEAADAAQLVINPIIYAEVSTRFSRIEELEDVLPKWQFAREPISFEAAFLAGKAHLAYRRRGGARSSPLPDFFIGAHASTAGYSLLTRDPRRFRTYFPNVQLIAPSDN
ncbi:MAG TPA: type II toxin-antitoxin system VapC family toxin [Caulobacteraceae bacterium]